MFAGNGRDAIDDVDLTLQVIYQTPINKGRTRRQGVKEEKVQLCILTRRERWQKKRDSRVRRPSATIQVERALSAISAPVETEVITYIRRDGRCGSDSKCLCFRFVRSNNAQASSDPARNCFRRCMIIPREECQLVTHQMINSDACCIQTRRYRKTGVELCISIWKTSYRINAIGTVWQRKNAQERPKPGAGILSRGQRGDIRRCGLRLTQSQSLVREKEKTTSAAVVG